MEKKSHKNNPKRELRTRVSEFRSDFTPELARYSANGKWPVFV